MLLKNFDKSHRYIFDVPKETYFDVLRGYNRPAMYFEISHEAKVLLLDFIERKRYGLVISESLLSKIEVQTDFVKMIIQLAEHKYNHSAICVGKYTDENGQLVDNIVVFGESRYRAVKFLQENGLDDVALRAFKREFNSISDLFKERKSENEDRNNLSNWSECVAAYDSIEQYKSTGLSTTDARSTLINSNVKNSKQKLSKLLTCYEYLTAEWMESQQTFSLYASKKNLYGAAAFIKKVDKLYRELECEHSGQDAKKQLADFLQRSGSVENTDGGISKFNAKIKSFLAKLELQFFSDKSTPKPESKNFNLPHSIEIKNSKGEIRELKIEIRELKKKLASIEQNKKCQ
ncbi:hypothetical protein Q4557_12880 [Shewanella sp. 5_MG-2023]|uniref:hypothetical protein n=1 Tax=Shewanella sp. 5_MG-2023 TaxID=3062656 RepID=UPI0026E43C1F|nr:hypothetical protein [Shewanella sp. 5_MG-2023]MDO6640850.1 hypothetical protein [Shewanella sp. 5_MG-2023]